MKMQVSNQTDNEKLMSERLKELQKLRVRRMKEQKYRYYEPNGVGEEFIDAFASNEYFILFLSAANGVGKTALAANILSHLMFPIDDNIYFNKEIFKDFPYRKRGRIITDSALVGTNAIPELKFWMPEGRYITSKNNKHYESWWETDTGWKFDVMTYQQQPKEFEGVTLGWAWFDEPPPDAILKATIARMRRGGIIIITATPISGSAHLYDMFAEGEVEVEVPVREGEEPQKIKRKVFHLTADVESACIEHGVRGHLEHEHILQMIAEYPEEETQARIYGKFQHLIGLVFKRFSREIHTIEPFILDPKEYTVYEFLDPHPRTPDAVLWLAVDSKGTKYVCDELFFKPKAIPELAGRIQNKASNYRIEGRWADPFAFNSDQHRKEGHKSWAELLADEGLHYVKAPKAREAADKSIEKALDYREVNGFMQKAPELYIFDTCKRTIWEMEHYRWDEWEGKTQDKRNKKQRPIDKDDHMIENLGRALLLDLRFVPQKTQTRGSIDNSSFDPYS